MGCVRGGDAHERQRLLRVEDNESSAARGDEARRAAGAHRRRTRHDLGLAKAIRLERHEATRLQRCGRAKAG